MCSVEEYCPSFVHRVIANHSLSVMLHCNGATLQLEKDRIIGSHNSSTIPPNDEAKTNRMVNLITAWREKLLALVLLLTCCLSTLALSSPSSSSTPFRQLRIAFCTGNKMKAHEVKTIFSEHGATKGPSLEQSLVQLTILEVDLPEIQEVDTAAIAKNKALLGAQLAGGPCMVEDTSLQFTALGGMPGPYIKWFQDRLGSEGLYNILAAYSDKSATAVCTLAFCPTPHADPVLFTGSCHGRIVAPESGRGFGWDSIFLPDGSDVPFSLMTLEQKCRLSHRGKVVRKFADWLGANKEALFERQEGVTAIGHKGLSFKAVYPEQ
jgi:inosine triphosphate pyrophosphatase